MQQTNDVQVSVICTAYNHEKYIRQCLEGFVMQKTNFKFEVLVHDDASTDGTADIIREYAAKYPDIIKPIYQTENQYSKGVNIGKNYLYPIAKGKYFAYCEGDDYWCDENKLQLQFDAMETHPECSMCVHLVACIDASGNSLGWGYPVSRYNLRTGVIDCNDACKLILADGTYIFQTSSYFSKAGMIHVKNQLENTDFSLNNGDIQMLMAAISLGPIYYDEKTMSCYRTLSEGSWSSRILNRSLAQQNARMLRLIESYWFFNEYTRGKYQQHLYKAICNYLPFLWTYSTDRTELKKYRPAAKIVYRDKQHHLSYRLKLAVWYYCPRLYRTANLLAKCSKKTRR